MKTKLNKHTATARWIALIILVSSIAFIKPAQSQPHVSINIGVQPLWGPVGYDYVEYYYLPAYEVYYYVPRHQFVYLDGGSWRFATALPPRFGPIDYYSTYKVVVNEPKAYLHYKEHKVKYVGGGPKQIVIRDSREPKYYVVKGHPNYGGGGKKEGGPERSMNSHGNMHASPSPKGNHGGGGGHGHGGGKH
jgi:hypothetical protein